MGKQRNKHNATTKRTSQRYKVTNTAEIEAKQKEVILISLDEDVSNSEYRRFQTRVFNFWKKCFLIAASILLVAAVLAFGVLLYFHIFKRGDIESAIFDATQCLVSVLSLAFGICGWALTIKSSGRHREPTSHKGQDDHGAN